MTFTLIIYIASLVGCALGFIIQRESDVGDIRSIPTQVLLFLTVCPVLNTIYAVSMAALAVLHIKKCQPK